jgi:hypothetical protein
MTAGMIGGSSSGSNAAADSCQAGKGAAAAAVTGAAKEADFGRRENETRKE